MIITDIKQQIKSNDRVSLFVDDKFVCGLNLNQLLELKLKKGQVISSPDLRRVKELSDLGKLVSSTIDLIARRPRSHKEVVDYLRRKQTTEEEREYVLSKVDKYIDDKAFAEFWVNGRRGSKHKSSRSITAELLQKGVAMASIKEALEENSIKDDSALRTLIEKKKRQTRYQDKDKLMQYLIRSGFNYSDVREVLEEAEG